MSDIIVGVRILSISKPLHFSVDLMSERHVAKVWPDGSDLFSIKKQKTSFYPFGFPLLSHQQLCRQSVHPPQLCVLLLTTVTPPSYRFSPTTAPRAAPHHRDPSSSPFSPLSLPSWNYLFLFYLILICLWDFICDWFLWSTSTTHGFHHLQLPFILFIYLFVLWFKRLISVGLVFCVGFHETANKFKF